MPSWSMKWNATGEAKKRCWRRTTFTIVGEARIAPIQPEVTGGRITFITQKGSAMGEITVKAEETGLSATVQFTDSKGNVTTPDEIPTWEVSSEDILTVAAADDGLSAIFEVVGKTGVCAVSVKTVETHGGVGDPTDIILTGAVTVIAGATVAGSIVFTTETTPTPPDEPVQLPADREEEGEELPSQELPSQERREGRGRPRPY